MSQRSAQDEAIGSRLEVAMGDRTVRHVGALTNTHPETVRRYMSGTKTPSVDFLAAFCEALEINADWLLTGEGHMRLEEKRKAVIRDAGLSDVLRAMAEAVDRLTTRVDRMEAVLRMHDDRLRATPGSTPGSPRGTTPGAIPGSTPKRVDHPDRDDATTRPAESSRVHNAINRMHDELGDRPGLDRGGRRPEDG